MDHGIVDEPIWNNEYTDYTYIAIVTEFALSFSLPFNFIKIYGSAFN